MSFQTLSISQIKASNANPRSNFNDESIKGLAQSIKIDGLLQNLVVMKPKGKKKTYSIISGERRFRALCLLKDQGDLPQGFQVSVEVRENLNEMEALRLATVENLQREDMHPLDEANAIAMLLQNGETVDNISSKTGLSHGVIKRRLALDALCDGAKTALRTNEINLSQAEALTLGTQEQQLDIIEQGLDGYSKEDIKNHLTQEKASIAMAIFPIEYYTGTFTSDLFGTEEETYFDDLEQFHQLQENEIKIMQEKYEDEGFNPVEILGDYDYRDWQYRDAEDDEKGGVVIQVFNSGRIKCHEGLVSRDLDREVLEETAEQPFIEKKKPAYSRPLLEYMAMEKSIAVQSTLLSNPRKAKEVAVVQLLGSNDFCSRVALQQHKCVSYFGDKELQNASIANVQKQAQSILKLLDAEEFRDFCWTKSALEVYTSVKSLSDDDLDMLHLFFTTLCFGQGNNQALDTNKSSFFNMVALDLAVDMEDHWYANEAFLSKRNKEQLSDIIDVTKSNALFGTAAKWKKGDLVKKLAEHFKRIFETGAQTPEEEVARAWLPEAMNFPAINPDKQVQE